MAGGRPARRQGGRGWLELAVAAVLLSVLAAVLIRALLQYQALAESTAVEMTIMNMRSGLRYRIAELILANRTQEVASLAGANPIGWLVRPPEGYLGEAADSSATDEMPPGTWLFDAQRRELVYRMSSNVFFSVPEGERKEIRLRVVSMPGSGTPGALLGVSIQIANRYTWQ